VLESLAPPRRYGIARSQLLHGVDCFGPSGRKHAVTASAQNVRCPAMRSPLANPHLNFGSREAAREAMPTMVSWAAAGLSKTSKNAKENGQIAPLEGRPGACIASAVGAIAERSDGRQYLSIIAENLGNPGSSG
jgi:hypothetical protein